MLVDLCDFDLLCIFALLYVQKIQVFSVCLARYHAFGLATVRASFKIKLELQHILVLQLHSVLHETQSDGGHASPTYREHAKDLRYQRIGIHLIVRDVAIKNAYHEYGLCFADGLNHEFLVVSQKEEAATLSRALASIKNLIMIAFG